MQETGGDDAVGLVGEELAPGRAGALRGRVDSGGMKDFPACGWGDRVAEAGEFALCSAVAPAAVFAGQGQDEPLDGRGDGWAAGATVLGEGPSACGKLPMPAQQCGRGDCEGRAPSPAWDPPRQHGRPDPLATVTEVGLPFTVAVNVPAAYVWLVCPLPVASRATVTVELPSPKSTTAVPLGVPPEMLNVTDCSHFGDVGEVVTVNGEIAVTFAELALVT